MLLKKKDTIEQEQKMETIIEIILELILEGSLDISGNKKISKWIRYPIAGLLILFFAAIILLLIVVGLTSLKDNLWFGILLLGVGIFMLIATIIRFNKILKAKKDQT